jgi:Fe-S oxidoreductase
LSDQQVKRVVDECYQCKLCYPICPYVPPHEWLIDFPAHDDAAPTSCARSKPASGLADRLFGDTDRVGTLSSWFAPLVKLGQQKSDAPRPDGEISRHPPRPPAADRIIARRSRSGFASVPAGRKAKARRRSRFSTPARSTITSRTSARQAVAVFEKNGIECAVPEQQCCGLPFLDVGQMERALEKMEGERRLAREAVRQGYKIVAPSASCSYMLKQDYPRFLPTEDAKLVSAEHL